MTQEQERILREVVNEESEKVFYEVMAQPLLDRLRKNVEDALLRKGIVPQELRVMQAPERGSLSLVTQVRVNADSPRMKFVVREFGVIHVQRETPA